MPPLPRAAPTRLDLVDDEVRGFLKTRANIYEYKVRTRLRSEYDYVTAARLQVSQTRVTSRFVLHVAAVSVIEHC